MVVRWEYKDVVIPFSVRAEPVTDSWHRMFSAANSAVTAALQQLGREGWTADCNTDARALLDSNRIAAKKHSMFLGLGQPQFTYGPITIRVKRMVN